MILSDPIVKYTRIITGSWITLDPFKFLERILDPIGFVMKTMKADLASKKTWIHHDPTHIL